MDMKSAGLSRARCLPSLRPTAQRADLTGKLGQNVVQLDHAAALQAHRPHTATPRRVGAVEAVVKIVTAFATFGATKPADPSGWISLSGTAQKYSGEPHRTDPARTFRRGLTSSQTAPNRTARNP